jgi:hypothetical protein
VPVERRPRSLRGWPYPRRRSVQGCHWRLLPRVSFSSDEVAVWVCLSASFAVQGIWWLRFAIMRPRKNGCYRPPVPGAARVQPRLDSFARLSKLIPCRCGAYQPGLAIILASELNARWRIGCVGNFHRMMNLRLRRRGRFSFARKKKAFTNQFTTPSAWMLRKQSGFLFLPSFAARLCTPWPLFFFDATLSVLGGTPHRGTGRLRRIN